MSDKETKPTFQQRAIKRLNDYPDTETPEEDLINQAVVVIDELKAERGAYNKKLEAIGKAIEDHVGISEVADVICDILGGKSDD